MSSWITIWFVFPVLLELDVTIYEEQGGGTLQVAQSIGAGALRFGEKVTPVVKAPIGAAVWGVRAARVAGQQTGHLVVRVGDLLKTPAGKLASRGNLAHTIIVGATESELGECLGTEYWYDIPWFSVDRGVGQRSDYGKCKTAIDNFATDIVSSALFGINFVEAGASAVEGVSSSVGNVLDFVNPF